MPKIDVVITNPPYKSGKNSLFYIKFVKLAYELSNSEIICFVTPPTVYRKIFELYKTKFEYINLDPTLKEKYFPEIGLGQFTYFLINKTKLGDSIIIDYGTSQKIINANELKFNILDERNFDRILNSIWQKYYAKGIKQKFSGKGDLITTEDDNSHIFQKSKNNVYKFPAYLSSKADRKNVFSKNPGEGFGIKKIVVSSILEPHKSEKFSKFSFNEAVGRYSYYYKVVNEIEAKNIQSFFNTTFYEFLDKTGRKPRDSRYAFLDIPNIDFQTPWDNNKLYEYYEFTEEEIAYIESEVKSSN
jgi:hypothetical protein